MEVAVMRIKWEMVGNELDMTKPGAYKTKESIDKYSQMIGKTVGSLYISDLAFKKSDTKPKWQFYTKCTCGNEQWQDAANVWGGHTVSCPGVCNLDGKIDSKLIIGPGCWGWSGTKNDEGRSVMWHGKIYINVARAIYERYNGALNDGDMICHRCDNPACVNPDHLFLGNASINVLDMLGKGRGCMGREKGHPDVKLICDLNFGSTGKGLIAGYIAETWCPDAVAIAWMPNAGHTYIDGDGNKFIHTMVPNGVVSKNLKTILIGPGAMINPEALLSELESCVNILGDRINHIKVYIHPNAGVVTQGHRDTEKGPMTKIGSTKKGCGAAIIQRIQRDPDNMNTASAVFGRNGHVNNSVEYILKNGLSHAVFTATSYNRAALRSEKILVEMAQGFSLSVYHGFYPYCTSRDCTPGQGLVDVGIPFTWVTDVIGTLRTFPIRVANRYNEEGEMIGWSGPCYSDQEETTWWAINQAPEQTTVTKLERRVFTFSMQQVMEACNICRPTKLFLNFCNYLSASDSCNLVEGIEKWTGIPVQYTGHGATKNDVINREALK